MASEVTMKDLQSLQGHCNKSIADLKKQIQPEIAGVQEEMDAVCQSLTQAFDKIKGRLDALEKAVKTLSATADRHATAITEILKL